MHHTIEIHKPLVAALRMSDALPNTQSAGIGSLHVLYGEGYTPVGYLVEKTDPENQWESLDPRFFITTSHDEAVRLLMQPLSEMPAREFANA